MHGRTYVEEHMDKVRPKVERVAWAMCESDYRMEFMIGQEKTPGTCVPGV